MKDTLVVKKATPLGARVWTSLLVFGFIGQIAWMVENVYFSTYIQKNITAAGWATPATVPPPALARCKKCPQRPRQQPWAPSLRFLYGVPLAFRANCRYTC